MSMDSRWRQRYDRPMTDLLFVAMLVGFFLLAGLFVRGCDRIVGTDEETPTASTPATIEAEAEHHGHNEHKEVAA
jgi:hypothetical protein